MANIRVYARIRPDLKVGKASRRQDGNQWLVQEDDQELSVDSQAAQVATPSSRSRASTPTSKGRKRTFRFDRILSASTTQEEVFDEVARHIVDRCVDGFNGTIFAYGVTGSGKTYTVEGSCRRYAERGLIARCLSRLYEQLGAKEGCESNVHISYLEVYQDAGYDLLNPGARGQSMMATLPKVTVTQQGESVVIRNLSSHLAANEDVALNLHFQGQANRRIAETPLNQRSSRSHAMFTITVTTQELDSEVITRSKLHLVDLAGSERVSKSGVQGQLLSEAKHINLSLHHLEHVIVMLHKKTKEWTPGEADADARVTTGNSHTSHGSRSLHSRSHSSVSTPATRSSTRGQQRGRGHQRDYGHIPYRNSLLTMLLRDSLGGNCHTAMIATLAQNVDGQGEAISTCTFAQRVACITNAVRRNEDLDDKAVIRKLKLRVAELEAEVERYRAKLAAPAISDHTATAEPTLELPMSTDEKELCMKVMKQFLMGEIADPVAAGIDNVRKFRQCMQFLQLLIRTRAAHSSHAASHDPANAQAERTQQRPAIEQARLMQDTGTASQDGTSARSVGHHHHQDNGGGTPAAQFAHYGNRNHSQTLAHTASAQPSGSVTTSQHVTATLPMDRNHDGAATNQTVWTHHSSPRAEHSALQPAARGQRDVASEMHLSPPSQPSSHPNSPRTATSPPAPTSPTSPRNKRSPHISPSSLHNISPRNQKPVFATVFEQQRAKEIERRSQRLLEVQTLQEQKQHHLILSQLILLENEQRLHLESLSEALATQHARVKALVRQGAAPSDIRQEQLAEQSLRKRQVEAHRKLELIQHQLAAYREKMATETKPRVGEGQTSSTATTAQQRHPRTAPASGEPTSPRLRASTKAVGGAQDTAVAGTGARLGAPHTSQQTTGYTSPTAAAAVAAHHHQHTPASVSAGQHHQHTPATPSGGAAVTPRMDARRVMKALAQEEAKQRELNAQMDHFKQSQFEEELAAKERATRLKLQQFRAMLQGQSVSQQAAATSRAVVAGRQQPSARQQPSTSTPQLQAGSMSEKESKHFERSIANSSSATPATSHMPSNVHSQRDETFAKHAWSPTPTSALSSQQPAAAQQQNTLRHRQPGAVLIPSQPLHAQQANSQSMDHEDRQRADAMTTGDHDKEARHQLKKERKRQQRMHATSPSQLSSHGSPARVDSREDRRQQQAARELSDRNSTADTLRTTQAMLRHRQPGDGTARQVSHAQEDLPEAEQHQPWHTSAKQPAAPALKTVTCIAHSSASAAPSQGAQREERETSKQAAARQLSPSTTQPQAQCSAGITAKTRALSSDSAHVPASSSSHIRPSSPTFQRQLVSDAVQESPKRHPQAEASAPKAIATVGAAAASPMGASHVKTAGKSAGHSSGGDGEKRFMTAAQRQRDRVERIRKAQRAAGVIQRSWRRYSMAKRRRC